MSALAEELLRGLVGMVAQVALYRSPEAEADDPGYRRQPVRLDRPADGGTAVVNDAEVRFGPWVGPERIWGWALFDAGRQLYGPAPLADGEEIGVRPGWELVIRKGGLSVTLIQALREVC